jgi:hypothetical protein
VLRLSRYDQFSRQLPSLWLMRPQRGASLKAGRVQHLLALRADARSQALPGSRRNPRPRAFSYPGARPGRFARPRRDDNASHSGIAHVAFDHEDSLRSRDFIDFVSHSHTPRNSCVRFVFGVTAASRNTRYQAGAAPYLGRTYMRRPVSRDFLLAEGA